MAAAFSLFALPAAAADEDCKAELTAEGKPAQLRDLGAYPNSLLAWRAAVREKYGSEYNSWRYAKDRDVDCTKTDSMWVCVRTAKPCKDVLHRLLDTGQKSAKFNCKDEALSSYGARKSSEDAAIKEAEYGWMIDVRRKYGKDWAEWENATDTDIDCRSLSGGRTQCVAVGTACVPK